jgi:hypothetical protein
MQLLPLHGFDILLKAQMPETIPLKKAQRYLIEL